MRKSYPSDISRKQFAAITEYLEAVHRKTAPRKVDSCGVFCAVLYVLRTACPWWRALPADLPKWPTVHSYCQIWSQVNEQGVACLGWL